MPTFSSLLVFAKDEIFFSVWLLSWLWVIPGIYKSFILLVHTALQRSAATAETPKSQPWDRSRWSIITEIQQWVDVNQL